MSTPAPAPVPTQVRRPWRATVRTAFQFVLGLAVILPFMVEATGLEPEVYPWLAGVLGVAAAFTRIMALESVENFLQKFFPWLSAAPAPKEAAYEGRRRLQRGEVSTRTLAIAALVTSVVVIVLILTDIRVVA